VPRRPTPLAASDGPIAEFALALRALRDHCGAAAPSIDQISARNNIPRATLYAALRGQRVPTRSVLAALVGSWGGDQADWMAKRSEVERRLEVARLGRETYPAPRAGHRERFSAPAGPLTSFAARMQALRRQAGQPSLREISRATEIAIGTLSQTFSGKALPSWPVVETLVIGLKGDPFEWRQEWILAQRTHG
jgi:hypothetical protein